MAEAYYLTEADLAVLRELIEDRKTRAGNIRRKPTSLPDEGTSPDVYIIRAPEGGIPANDANTTGTGTTGLEDDVPGSAECEVYRIEEDGVLRQAGFTVTVYNLSPTAVDGATPIIVNRDKFGSWLVTGIAFEIGDC